ncbi:CPBP family intramembrane metalloprotease [Clostridium sp. YIM B02505]|uniref:CPBP family intramembrane metalloprotease n=1 Tax=Clostridium yunnanense TaxID=2800325 RepID=A0ABS1EMW7_9CLOT|nr:CPBP family glutamic-type intramembrane protease [Clostridium yunnanense]MBK1810710.1 CPBP family intramembrane metalloprotease [Clostridium yunnanense]
MNKKYPFILPLFRSILFIIVGVLFTIITNKSLEQASKWWSVICTICNIITIAVLVAICKSEGYSYRKLIGYQKGQNTLKYTLLIIIIMLILGMGGMYGFGFMIYGYVPVTMVQPIPVWMAIINVILLPLTVVFAELPLYFGYALNGIEKITGNKILAIVYPMFFYALQHSFIPLLFDWKHILFRFLSFLPLMCVLGIIYYKKRKLQPLMIGHAILDLATGSQILMTSISPAIFEMMKAMSK